MDYIYCDGDAVGRRLHALIAKSELKEAAQLSGTVTRVLRRIKLMLQDAGIEVVLAGGDNLFARGNAEHALLERVIALFHSETGLTMSIGVGKTPGDAILAIIVAKSLGGGRLIWR